MNNHFYRWFGRSVRQGEALKSLVKTTLMAITMLVSLSTFAQDKTVTGKVTDKSDGSGMPGVSISVKGSNKGTQTNVSGEYKISAPANATLIFSFVGYAKQEIAIGNRSELSVSLVSSDKALDEVVVIGYGTQKVKDATGAVASLGSKDFNKGVINSPEQLLQGRIAGVQMTPNSGDPGAGININIRGTASLRGNNNPLFVVDNVPLDNSDIVNNQSGSIGAGSVSSRNPLNFLNPADIENISVLKDASAAAIYGARGANGVVLITTKKGKSGAGTFNFSVSGSISSAAKKYDLLSPSEFKAEMVRAGQDVNNKLIIGGASTDWQDQVLRTAYTKNYNMSFGGGSDKTSYYFSLGYQDQQGIIKNTSQDKLQARINATHKLIDDKVTVGIALTTAKLNDEYGATSGNVGFDGNLISRMINLNPTFPVYAADGSYFTTGGVSFRNPVSLLNNYHQTGPTNRTLANVFASWEIIKGLTYKASLSQDNVATTLNSYVDVNTPGFQNSVPNNAGGVAIGNLNRTTSTIEHTLNFKQAIGSHDFDVLAGFSYQKFANSGSNVNANYFTVPAGTNLVNNIGYVDNTGNNKPYSGGSFANLSELQSFFGRAAYNFAGKYYLTGTLRVDGSSKFGANNKYGYFPAVNGAWKISGEDFMKDSFFSNLKLRAGYGVVGNSEGFPANQTITTFIPNANNGGISKENISNPDLKWESTTSYGLGVDFSLMKGRLSGTVDYFNKTTNNLLFPLSASQPDVATTRWSNLDASVVNKGVEVSLSYDIIKGGDFGWTASANATFLDNKLEKLNNTVLTGDIFGQGLSGAFVQPLRAGYPLYSFFVPEFKGFSDKGQNILSADAIYAGSPFPTATWGLNNDFTFGKFTLGLFINGQSGGYIFNNTALALGGAPTLNQGNNSDKAWIDTKESFTNGLAASTRFVEKSDFIRVSNFSLGRRIEVDSKYIKGLHVSLSGQNLLLISSYKGLDPEVTNPGASRNGITSRGIDYVSYPKARTFTLSVSANF
jgi:TonB-dependent starch-binding outer membrane protein SusC